MNTVYWVSRISLCLAFATLKLSFQYETNNSVEIRLDAMHVDSPATKAHWALSERSVGFPNSKTATRYKAKVQGKA